MKEQFQPEIYDSTTTITGKTLDKLANVPISNQTMADDDKPLPQFLGQLRRLAEEPSKFSGLNGQRKSVRGKLVASAAPGK